MLNGKRARKHQHGGNVAEELEIKLTVDESSLGSVIHWLLAQSGARDGGRKSLVNRYYDTPEVDLNQQRAALRVRQAGDRFIQTLKTQGEFVAGAHRRQEWEWELPGPELNIGLLADTPLGQDVNLARLQAVFETNFQRQVIWLEQSGATVEVAVDSGQIISGSQARPLHEVEFELKAGDSRALVTWARKLAEQVPVFLNLVSKAEQGYCLAGLYSLEPGVTVSEEPLSATGFLRMLSVCWLLEQPCAPVRGALSDLRRQAADEGCECCLDRVIAALAAGTTIPALARDGELGRLQLALAAP